MFILVVPCACIYWKAELIIHIVMPSNIIGIIKFQYLILPGELFDLPLSWLDFVPSPALEVLFFIIKHIHHTHGIGMPELPCPGFPGDFSSVCGMLLKFCRGRMWIPVLSKDWEGLLPIPLNLQATKGHQSW